MNAVGRNTTRIIAANRGDGAEVGTFYRRHHDQPYAGPRRCISHCRTVTIKVGRIQMAMGVDQHGSLDFVNPGLLNRLQLLFAAMTLVFLKIR